MDHQYLAKIFRNLGQSLRFWGKYDYFLLYKQPKTELFDGTSLPPWYKKPLVPNTCINIVNIMWEWGLVSRVGGMMLQRLKTENVAFWSLLFYINNRVLLQFLCTILHEMKNIPSILSNCNLHTERIAHFDKFSRFSVFSHISKSPATIVFPCITLPLFLRIPISLSDLLLLGYMTSCK